LFYFVCVAVGKTCLAKLNSWEESSLVQVW
jgi:hypothetical protein